jgi:hypothetical protein
MKRPAACGQTVSRTRRPASESASLGTEGRIPPVPESPEIPLTDWLARRAVWGEPVSDVDSLMCCECTGILLPSFTLVDSGTLGAAAAMM